MMRNEIIIALLVATSIAIVAAHGNHGGRGSHSVQWEKGFEHDKVERMTNPRTQALSTISRAVVTGAVRAAAAKVDATLPIGTPLAGFNWGPRRVPHWPLPEIREYTTFMMPSTGVMQPTWAKALVIEAGTESVCFVTLEQHRWSWVSVPGSCCWAYVVSLARLCSSHHWSLFFALLSLLFLDGVLL